MKDAVVTALTEAALAGDVTALPPLSDRLEEIGDTFLATQVRKRMGRFRAITSPHGMPVSVYNSLKDEENRWPPRWYANRVLAVLPGVKLRIPDVVERFAAYHRLHPAWYSLHVMFDDNNTDDRTTLFCRQCAAEHGDVEGYALAMILEYMSPSQRGRLNRKVIEWEARRPARIFSVNDPPVTIQEGRAAPASSGLPDTLFGIPVVVDDFSHAGRSETRTEEVKKIRSGNNPERIRKKRHLFTKGRRIMPRTPLTERCL